MLFFYVSVCRPFSLLIVLRHWRSQREGRSAREDARFAREDAGLRGRTQVCEGRMQVCKGGRRFAREDAGLERGRSPDTYDRYTVQQYIRG